MIIQKVKEFFIKSSPKSKRCLLTSDETANIDSMFNAMNASKKEMTKPSKYWIELNRMNYEQLKENGFLNFKKTIALNYFTWVRIMPWNSQIRFLVKRLPSAAVISALKLAFFSRKYDFFSSFNYIQSLLYNYLTYLMWFYIKEQKFSFDWVSVNEPDIGSPPVTEYAGSRFSQDILNSVLEYESIVSGVKNNSKIKQVFELGAGYGRNAYVFMKMNPGVKYIIADIPPALWVAQEYLSQCFPEKKIFRFRDFKNFSEIKQDYEESDIVFLLSTQIEAVPQNSVDLCINISSLHEMRMDQIRYYMNQFDRLLKQGGYLYIKQWKVGHVLFENTVIRQEEYPIPSHLGTVFNREARIQTDFFEALYRK